MIPPFFSMIVLLIVCRALNRWRAEVRAKELAKLSEDKLKKDAIMGEQKYV